MRNMWMTVFGGLAVGGVCCPTAATAAPVKIEPGRWEITTTAQGTMMPTKVDTAVECVTRDHFDPTRKLVDNEMCQVEERARSATSLKWRIVCRYEVGTMEGQGEFFSAGATTRGRMQMSMSFDGQPVSFETRWKGRRIGPCH